MARETAILVRDQRQASIGRRLPGAMPKRDATLQRRQRWFKIGFGTLALSLVCLNVAVGVAAWVEERRITDFSLGAYDRAFDAAAQLNASALAFERYTAGGTAGGDANADELLKSAIHDMQTALERAPRGPERASREALLADLVALREPAADETAAPGRLADARDKFARLERLALADELRARAVISSASNEANWPLLCLAAARVVAAAFSFYVMYRFLRRMAQLTNYDPLTGLPKRALLRARLVEAARRLRRGGGGFALISLDLDNLGRINETLGHHIGDQTLQEAARRVSGRVRVGDIVARSGGDEFAILQSALRSPEEAGALAERLVAMLGAPYEIDGRRILIGASAGIALAPQDGADADELLRKSEVALRRAKTPGKGRVLYYDAAMVCDVSSPALRETDLREALDAKLLEVHFQPIVDFSTGRAIAFEALARWNRGADGYLFPADFLPLAEDSGMMIELGAYVLREACATAASWSSDIGVAVNLSAMQFSGNDLPSVVAAVLAETGLQANRLELEITESLLIEGPDEVARTLGALRERGARISLDDFGAGCSSLVALSSFPFDKIKIDTSVVRGAQNRAELAAIVRAIVALARERGATATAEGVESREERDWLQLQGCRQGQGFLFSEAVPARDVERLFDAPFPWARDGSAATKQAA